MRSLVHSLLSPLQLQGPKLRPMHSTGNKHSVGSQHADGKMRHREGLYLCALALLGLVRTSAGLWSQRLDSFHREMELRHLVVDETSGTWAQSFGFALINLVTIAWNACLETPWKSPIYTGNSTSVSLSFLKTGITSKFSFYSSLCQPSVMRVPLAASWEMSIH